MGVFLPPFIRGSWLLSSKFEIFAEVEWSPNLDRKHDYMLDVIYSYIILYMYLLSLYEWC